MRLKRKPKQGQTFSMWGREFTISRVCPMRSWIEVTGPRPEELTDVNDGVMSFTYVPALRPSAGTIDFRISTLPVVDNEKIVMRVLDTSTGVPSLEQLGFRGKYREAMEIPLAMKSR